MLRRAVYESSLSRRVNEQQVTSGSSHYMDRHPLHAHLRHDERRDDNEEDSQSISSAGSQSGTSLTGSTASDSASSCSGDHRHHDSHSCSDDDHSTCCSFSHSSSSSCHRTGSSCSSDVTRSGSTDSSIEWIRESTDRQNGSLFYVKLLGAGTGGSENEDGVRQKQLVEDDDLNGKCAKASASGKSRRYVCPIVLRAYGRISSPFAGPSSPGTLS